MELHTEYRIPVIGKPLSRLVLGTAFFNPQSEEKGFELLEAFRKAGGTILDSARAYGESEKVVGAWLAAQGHRGDMVVISKCGHGVGVLPEDGFENLVGEELATSLANLQTDYIDLYMLHRDNPGMPVERIMDRLNIDVEAGRVRALGASNWSYDRVEAANDYALKNGLAGFSVVSNNLSLGEPAGPFYPGLVSTDANGEAWHERTSVPLIPWSAQARGFFTGMLTPGMAKDPDAIEEPFMKRMAEIYGTNRNFERLRRARELGKQKDATAMEIALAWLLHKPFAVLPVVGPRTPEELASCLKATALKLSADECSWLAAA